jgi:hypothetical protein
LGDQFAGAAHVAEELARLFQAYAVRKMRLYSNSTTA